MDENLTDLEQQILKASTGTEYGDARVEPVWSFAVALKAGMEDRKYRGVVSSLVKKGYVDIFAYEQGRKEYEDQLFTLTEKGREAAILLLARDLLVEMDAGSQIVELRALKEDLASERRIRMRAEQTIRDAKQVLLNHPGTQMTGRIAHECLVEIAAILNR